MSVDTGKELFRLGFLTAIEIPDRGYVGGLLITNHFGRPLEFQCTAPLKPNRTQEILYGPTLVPYVLGDLIGRTLIEKVGVKPHIVLTERQDLLGLRELVEIPVACVDDLPANEQAVPQVSEELPSIEPEAADGDVDLVPSDEPVAVVQPPNDEPASNGSTDVEQSVLETSIGEPALDPFELNVDSTPSPSPSPSAVMSSALETPVGVADNQPVGVTSLSREEKRPITAELSADSTVIQLGRQVLRFHVAHASDRSVASRGARVVPNDADLREPFERVREALGETARLGGSR
jgi:hypothetical protein